jgi:polyisoprenoid-binding protein YceI
VEARSNVGTVSFGTTSVTGCVEAVRVGGAVDATQRPKASLRIPVASLRSGNALYDAELHTRLAVHRYPVVDVELDEAQAVGGARYKVAGRVTLHGVTCTLVGGVTLTLEGNRLEVTGEEVIDIRQFGIELPTVLMLRIYPEVRVRLQLLAHEDERVLEGA